MYEKPVQTLLDKKKLSVGDRIRIVKAGKTYEGLLLPRPDIGDKHALVLKLDSGYNVGILVNKDAILEKLTSESPQAVQEEEQYELGKVRKELLELNFNPAMPPISLVATGGTIASRIDYRTGGVYSVEDPREFLHNIPELAEFTRIARIGKPFTKMSEDLDPQDWIALAKVVHKELQSDSRGVVVTHGTDTLHYSSAALSFFLRNPGKPVAMLGSQRSSDRGSSDAGVNILCASRAALGPYAEVGVCMHGTLNDDYCLFIRGTKVRKMHTSRRDAFRPINDVPIARVFPDGKFENVRPDAYPRTDEPGELDAVFEQKVALVKAFPGSDPAILDAFRARKYAGILIEGTGFGHVPTFARNSWIPTIKRLVKDGIPVAVASQAINGRVNPSVYSPLRVLYHEAGAIPCEDMHAETAFVKLGWVLAHTTDMDEVRRRMQTNVAGEITKRSENDLFLQ